ncbi:SIR2 family protein [Microbulbifer magnicolonia]|uniref:SIR2 family protein n=1 Tax=Microbulbifer magnicolonia TaxID=3109744 RepID=UPI002B4046AF|nr:SIR2 family protein [Microbulbifer sp. GG15]
MATEEQKKRLIRTLSEELQERNLAIFAGAGLSAAAGFVNWSELLKPIADDLELDINREKDNLVSLAQYHCNENAANRSRLNQLLISNFCNDKEVTINHKILARLPIDTFWTTNYDRLIEKAISETGKVPDIKYKTSQLAHTKPKRDAIVYKMHGDVEHPSDAVLTKDDYERYHVKMQPFINALSGDLVSKTFLFLGFSFTDPNLDYILSRVRVAYDSNQRQHYCILRHIQESDCEDNVDFEYQKRKQAFFIRDLLRFGIKTFLIDEYAEITKILEELEGHYRRNTIFISGAAHEYHPRGPEESNRFVFNLSKLVIENDFNIVSGFGLGIGSSVITGALENIYMKGDTIRDERLLLRPFPQHQSGTKDLKTLWTEYRKDMLSFSGIALFLFGNKFENGKIIHSNGMREEYEIAKKNGQFLLPIGATGYMALELWNEVNKDFEAINGIHPQEIKLLFSDLGDNSISLDEILEKTIKLLKILRK